MIIEPGHETPYLITRMGGSCRIHIKRFLVTLGERIDAPQIVVTIFDHCADSKMLGKKPGAIYRNICTGLCISMNITDGTIDAHQGGSRGCLPPIPCRYRDPGIYSDKK